MFKPIDRSHIPDLKVILDEVYSNHPFPIGGGWTVPLLLEALAEGEGFALFESPNDIKAFLIYRRLQDVLDITVLATALKFQRQGIMRRLLDHVFATMPQQRIWLEVHEKNAAAVQLYEAMGFRLQGKRTTYYRDGGTALLYSLEK